MKALMLLVSLITAVSVAQHGIRAVAWDDDDDEDVGKEVLAQRGSPLEEGMAFLSQAGS